jgi:hypothetical protein
MRLRTSALLAAMAVMSASALPETKDATTIFIESLARVDGIISYCARTDAKNAQSYQDNVAMIIRGHSRTEIQGDRGTSRYQYALGVINLQLSKISTGTGMSACKTLVHK